jgi:hypothetical protein
MMLKTLELRLILISQLGYAHILVLVHSLRMGINLSAMKPGRNPMNKTLSQGRDDQNQSPNAFS